MRPKEGSEVIPDWEGGDREEMFGRSGQEEEGMAQGRKVWTSTLGLNEPEAGQ